VFYQTLAALNNESLNPVSSEQINKGLVKQIKNKYSKPLYNYLPGRINYTFTHLIVFSYGYDLGARLSFRGGCRSMLFIAPCF